MKRHFQDVCKIPPPSKKTMTFDKHQDLDEMLKNVRGGYRENILAERQITSTSDSPKYREERWQMTEERERVPERDNQGLVLDYDSDVPLGRIQRIELATTIVQSTVVRDISANCQFHALIFPIVSPVIKLPLLY